MPNDIRPVIIIPTYNNEKTILQVIAEVKEYVGDVIVVDDGSIDKTGEILSSKDTIRLITFPKNRGKGAALQAGFLEALKLGFTHAITIDADGQHLTSDIPLFIGKIHEEPETLWIGNRIIPIDKGIEQPPRSRFGRQIGAFWYKFHTGLWIRDTQCGFRAYPILKVNELKCKGNRYEYEIDVLIKAAWNKVLVKSLDVHIYYQEHGEAVSHFRPVRDFLRISGVNSRAAMTKIFFPLRFIDAPGERSIDKLKFLFLRELHANTSPLKAAFSLAFGVFMGIVPIHGFQVITLIPLSFAMRLNRPLALIGVSISSPPMLPFIIAAAVALGKIFSGIVMHGPLMHASAVVNGFLYFVIGSCILAVLCAVATFTISLPIFHALLTRKAK